FSCVFPSNQYAVCDERPDAWWDDKHWPSGSQHQRVGIRRTIGIVGFLIPADDHKISSSRLASNEFSRKVERRSPLDLASAHSHAIAKLLFASAEHRAHLLITLFRRLGVNGDALHNERRPRHPRCYSNEVRMKAIG